ncbi:MAG: glycosyltransferase family 4 protein [Elusimicrobiota bacterium]
MEILNHGGFNFRRTKYTKMAEKIKVAHIITLLELGGAQKNTLYTCEHLDKNRFDVILICGKGGSLDYKTKNIKTFFVKELLRQICPICDLIALLKIYKILKKERPDIVHTHSSKAGILGRWAAYLYNCCSRVHEFTSSRVTHQHINTPARQIRSGGSTHQRSLCKIIHTFHGFGFNDEQNYFVKKIYILAEWLTAKITDKLIAVSYENISKGLKNKIGDKLQYTMIRSGIKLKDYQINPESGLCEIEKKKRVFGITNEQVVGMIACFKKQKSPLDFIKVAKLVCNEKPNTKFILVGDGILRNEIEIEIKNLELEKNVILTGWRKDTNEIIKIFDVFVLTSLWEGLPRVIVEAMASEVPVVATYVDGTKEIVQEGLTGFVVYPHEIEKLSERILKLLNNADLRKKFSQVAKKRVQEFDIDLMVSQQEKLYLPLADR